MALDFSEGLPLDVEGLRDVAHDFARQNLREAGLAADRGGAAQEGALRDAGELGLFAPNVPEEYGGPGVSVLAQAVMMEELGWGNLGLALGIGMQALCAEAVLRAGGEEDRAKLLGGLCGAQAITLAALCAAETEASADEAGGLSRDVRAQSAGEGYRLDGDLRLVPNAALAQLLVVRGALGGEGALFAVPADGEGVSVRRVETAGLRSLGLADVSLAGCALGAAARLSGDGAGKALRRVKALSRTLFAAALVGTARAAYEEAAAYARSRRTFGRPIVEHEQVGNLLAEMRLRIQAARLLAYRAAGDLDAGRDGAPSAAEASFLAGETAVWATRRAVQAFGGYGYTQEFPVEMWMRDAVGGRLLAGEGELGEVARAIAAGG